MELTTVPTWPGLIPEVSDEKIEHWDYDQDGNSVLAGVEHYELATCPEHGETVDFASCLPSDTCEFCSECEAEVNRWLRSQRPGPSGCETTNTDLQRERDLENDRRLDR